MTQVLTQAQAKQLGLAGRKSLEIVSGEKGSQAVTLRLVEIPVPQPGEKLRGPHFHNGFEECIFVMSGEGCMEADSGKFPVKAGDTLAVIGFTFTGEKGDAVLRAEYLWAGGGVYGLRSAPAL